MTAIAYKNGILAADTGITQDEMYVGDITKIYYSPKHQIAFALSGTISLFNELSKWIFSKMGKPISKWKLKEFLDNIEGDASFEVMLIDVKDDFAIYFIDENGISPPISHDYYSSGAASSYLNALLSVPDVGAVTAVGNCIENTGFAYGKISYIELFDKYCEIKETTLW